MGATPKTPEYPVDKILESKLAELIGTTQKALERKRERKVIPEGVWQKLDGRIIYSISRYNAWQESLWICPQGWNRSDESCGSASPGKAPSLRGDAKPSRSRKPQRGSQQQPVYLIK